MQGTVNYGNYMPITINATTPVGPPLQNQKLSIYVDNNYITSLITNNYGIAQYLLQANYSPGSHVLTVAFTNTTYFQEAVINYTFIVQPGTVYIIANVNSTNVTYGNAVSIYVKLSPPISGGTLTISYLINGTTTMGTIGSYTPSKWHGTGDLDSAAGRNIFNNYLLHKLAQLPTKLRKPNNNC
ncbi:hypothetical protein [Vulcanisaeta distributa]|uniref:hypothetical protein n=1 Tax=Vulcanisaeta distributa TaxID=164451 RepID=UPI000B27668F|nr:hypothetical protein [Vulcanisaeta distributa]